MNDLSLTSRTTPIRRPSSAWRRGGLLTSGPLATLVTPLASLALLVGLTFAPAPSHAMGESEYFDEQAARGRLDLDLLKEHGETDACFLYDKRHHAVFCVATAEAAGEAGHASQDTVWSAVFYDGKRHKLTTIPFAKRPKTSDDDDDWAALPKALKRLNKRLRKGRWAKRAYALDFDEGTRTPLDRGYALEVRGDETELAIYKGDAEVPAATYALQGLSGLYSAEGELPLIVVDEDPDGAKAASAVRVRVLGRKAFKHAAKKPAPAPAKKKTPAKKPTK